MTTSCAQPNLPKCWLPANSPKTTSEHAHGMQIVEERLCHAPQRQTSVQTSTLEALESQSTYMPPPATCTPCIYHAHYLQPNTCFMQLSPTAATQPAGSCRSTTDVLSRNSRGASDRLIHLSASCCTLVGCAAAARCSLAPPFSATAPSGLPLPSHCCCCCRCCCCLHHGIHQAAADNTVVSIKLLLLTPWCQSSSRASHSQWPWAAHPSA
jgi:hypothetical protein